MTQASLNDLIRVHLTLHGWPLQQIGWLAAFHGKSGEVTPFYCFAEAPMRPYGRLAVTGMIGVIHRGFETEWQQANPKGHRFLFAMSLHTSNFKKLNELSLIDPEPASVRSAVESYCEAVASILADMPQSQEQLLATFTMNKLGSHTISAYAGHVQRGKHAARRVRGVHEEASQFPWLA